MISHDAAVVRCNFWFGPPCYLWNSLSSMISLMRAMPEANGLPFQTQPPPINAVGVSYLPAGKQWDQPLAFSQSSRSTGSASWLTKTIWCVGIKLSTNAVAPRDKFQLEYTSAHSIPGHCASASLPPSVAL